MKRLFLWASVILVCYFAADVARVPTTALLAAGVSPAPYTISR